MKTLKIFWIMILAFPLFSEDGDQINFDNIEMDINDENYILFENESLVVCDRKTDQYLVEITPEMDLYVYGDKIQVDEYQRELLQEYYIAQYILFTKRNRIGAKSIEVGIAGAALAAKAVGGAFMLMATGFDEDEEDRFEKEMEEEAEEIERKAEMIEYHADEYEEQIWHINRLERELTEEIEILQDIALYVDDDINGINVDIDHD